MVEELVATFGKRKPKENNKLLDKLHQPPKKDSALNTPHFQEDEPGMTQQADLLVLPNDNGYKYALVVIDVGSRQLDAEPLQSRDSIAVKKAFNSIYKRKYISIPERIEVDPGAEFKGAVKTYFEGHGVFIRVGEVGRHRQQAVVERANQTIGSVLHKRMTGEELLTGKLSTEWVHDLPVLISAMNKRVKEMKKKKPTTAATCEGSSCKLLNEGDQVRVQLDYPIDTISGKKLFGKFRSSDLRWDTVIRTIKQVQLIPGQPPTYRLDGPVGVNKLSKVAYTKNQLQSVGVKEKTPSEKFIIKKWTIDKILSKKKIGGITYYQVKWVGFKETTFEPRHVLIADVPQMVAKFDAKH